MRYSPSKVFFPAIERSAFLAEVFATAYSQEEVFSVLNGIPNSCWTSVMRNGSPFRALTETQTSAYRHESRRRRRPWWVAPTVETDEA